MATANKPAEGVELDVPSAHQVYLESLLGEEGQEAPAPVYGGESVNPNELQAVTDDGYIGTDPVYQNYADDTHKPLAADGGVDQLAEEAYVEAVEGEPSEAGDDLKKHYGEVANTREEGTTIGGEPVHSTLTPLPPEDNEHAGVTSGATGAAAPAKKTGDKAGPK